MVAKAGYTIYLLMPDMSSAALVKLAPQLPPRSMGDRATALGKGLVLATKLDDPTGDDLEETPIRRTRVSDQIVLRLEAQIRSGAYQIGDNLPSERQLMRRFGVGRPAVREALFTLSKRGIIEVRSGMKPRVCTPDATMVLDDLSSVAKFFLVQPQGVAHFQEICGFLEVALARDAARHATPADVDRLRRALAANEAAIGDREAFIETDVAFHFVLAARTGNSILMAIHSAMARWLYEQRVVALRVPDIEPISFAGHKAIFDAIAAGDPDAAENAMESHLRDVARNYEKGRSKIAARAARDEDH